MATDANPAKHPSNAPLEETPFQSVSRTGATVAAASMSAKRNMPKTLHALNSKPITVGPVAR